MIKIKNKSGLVRNGKGRLNRKARHLALQSLEAGLNAADPGKIVRSRVLLGKSNIRVDGFSLDLRKFKSVYVIGGGKAGASMANAINQILGRRITRGFVNVLPGVAGRTGMIELHQASHPTPDESGVKGTLEMLKIVEKAGKEDLIICLISGGGSSLMPLPRDGVTLHDKREITQALLRSGATIDEINAVRKHISYFKGGWLAKKAYPATILNLVLSDVVGDTISSIASGPSAPDPTTFHDAITILKKHCLWGKTPESIQKLLSEGEKGVIPETPKPGDKVFRKVHNIVLGNNRSVTTATCQYLRSAGLNSMILPSTLEGEARHVGVILSSIAWEIERAGSPTRRPAAIVAGGETTVTVTGAGTGGRNQELVLAATPKLPHLNGVVLASLSTDGVDGPTDAAGAIADGDTLAKAARIGLVPEDFLNANDSYRFFSKLGDLVLTGPTGTNVNDVTVLVLA